MGGQRGKVRLFGWPDPARAGFDLGQRGQQPALRLGRQAGCGQQLFKRGPRAIGVAAQALVLGLTRARMQPAASSSQPGAGGVGRGIAPLHAAHRGQGQPGLRMPRLAFDQQLQRPGGGIELMQVLLQGGLHQQHFIGGLGGLGPGLQHGQRLPRKARVAIGSGLLEVAARQVDRQRRVVRIGGPLPAKLAVFCAAAAGRRQGLDHIGIALGRHHGGIRNADGEVQDQRRNEKQELDHLARCYRNRGWNRR